MNRFTSTSLLSLLAVTLASIAAAPLQAAEHGPGGGMHQQPIDPAHGGPNSGRPSRGTPPPDAQPPPGDRRGSSVKSFIYRGTSYLVSGGQWYERRGNELVAVAPPAGVLVDDLPDGYSMRWVGGVPYFYADGLYYVWRERQRRYEIMQNAPVEQSVPAHEARPDAGHEHAPAP